MSKKINKPRKISKLTVDEKEIKPETLPNPVVMGGLEEIGLKRISTVEIPKFILMHPALPRGIEMKANRLIKLADEDLESNVVINQKTQGDSEIKKEAREYCKKILYDSGGLLYLKKMSMGAHRFGTSFSVLQINKGENEVLKFEYQHEIFFGAARYPKVQKGVGVDWGEIPMIDRPSLAGKMKINKITKKIAKYTQLTKKYPHRNDHNYKFESAEYVNTRTHPAMKEQSPGELVATGKEYDESQVIQLFYDSIGDEPLGIPLAQYLHLTITYLLNMERAGAQTTVNFGFNKWVANTPFKTREKMEEFGKTLANIQKDSVVILPKDIDIKNIEPGTTEFDKIHPIYMMLIAIRLGIPVASLTQTGTQTNKNTLTEQRKDMYEDFFADELTIEATVNDGFFKACSIKWKDLSVEQIDAIVPKFKFNQPPEDKDTEMDRNLKFSLMERNFSTGIRDMSQSLELLSVIFPKKDYSNMLKTIDHMAFKIDDLIIKSLDREGLERLLKLEPKKKIEKAEPPEQKPNEKDKK